MIPCPQLEKMIVDRVCWILVVSLCYRRGFYGGSRVALLLCPWALYGDDYWVFHDDAPAEGILARRIGFYDSDHI